ncbi:hypothetical protein AB0J74_22385 [Asanoa sp. NPDC049573]|uniref:hypothetical protein n=1 Tax=Asanoa sp. NPDC049573 TaxID=3155396 RepID=UPI0034405588
MAVEWPEDLPVPATAPGRLRTITGTIAAGVEPNCLLIGGFLLIGGDRALLEPGARVTVTGRVDHTVVSTCQQGTPFVVTRVERA